MKGSKTRQPLFLATLVVVIAVVVGGCTDEKTIFVERVLFEDPPEAAQGFLGYDEEDRKLTTCGNCHVGQQAKWETTAHADAWETLQASGHASALCENCHTVGPNGNPTEGSVGYAATQAERYHDVQCESCHGPGLNHVTNPDARPRPVPSLTIFTVSAGDTTFHNCAECHQGAHHPFVEEWLQSKHSTPVLSPAGRAECISCHTAQGALAAWGVQAEYQEKDAPLGADQLGIVCSTCHDPHGGPNDAQLRFPINVPDVNTHLCMKCHHKRAVPEVDASTIRGPHSPEGPLLLGEAGWWPPGFEQDRILTTHGSSVNEKLCVTCHVTKFTVNEPGTGVFQFQATGHLFQAIPCLGPDGKPQVGEVCEDISERSFLGCLGAGCHASEDVARNAYSASKSIVDDLAAEVERLIALPAPAAAISNSDGIFTVAEGARFNMQLGQLPGSSTHNPFLTRQLLQASIKALKDTYGVTVSSGIVLDPEFQ